MRKNQIPFTCKTCGVELTASPSRERKYCSPECAYASKERVAHIQPKDRGSAICGECGIEFKLRTNGGTLFCSQRCASINTGTKTMHVNRRQMPKTKEVEKQCAACGKTFSSWQSNHRAYCSQDCAYNHADLKTRRVKTFIANGSNVNTYSRCEKGWVEIGGKRFFSRSRWEVNYARYLEFQKQQKIILDWDYEQETFWFNGIKRGCMSYLPDFKVTTGLGVEYHEVKGWMDSKSKTKIRRMAKYHPSVNLVVIDENRYKAIQKTAASFIPGWSLKSTSKKSPGSKTRKP